MKFQSIFFACIALFFLRTSFVTAQNGLDSTLLKSALTLDGCIQNQKKLIGKEVVITGFCVGSTQLEIEKEGLMYILELDNNYPNNKVSIIVTEEIADLINFSRYQYHQKTLIVKGKLEKTKKIRDEFGNPRLVIFVKQGNQILY